MLSQTVLNKTIYETKYLFNSGKYQQVVQKIIKVLPAKMSDKNKKYAESIFQLYRQYYEALLFLQDQLKIKKALAKLHDWAKLAGKKDWVDLEILEAQIRMINLEENQYKAQSFANKYKALMQKCFKNKNLEVALWSGNKYLKLMYFAKTYAGYEKTAKKLVTLAKKLNKEEALLWIYHHIGMLNLTKQKRKKAQEYFQKSLDLSYELNQKDGIIWNAYNLGLINMQNNADQESVSNYIFQAISAFNESGDNDLKHKNTLKSFIPQLDEHLMQFNRLGAVSKILASEIHELKNLLTGNNLQISNLKYLLENNKYLNKEIEEFIVGITVSNKLMTEKVKNILNYIKNKEQNYELTDEDLFKFLEKFKDQVNILLKDNIIELNIYNNTNEDKYSIKLASKNFYQVLLNLLLNSIEAMNGRENKKIEIEINKDNKGFYLIFKDNGPGISRDISGKIFEPFFTTKKEGTGLGLYIIKNQLNKAGMDIKLINNSLGVKFWIGWFS